MKSRMIFAAATLGMVVSGSAFAEDDAASTGAASKMRVQAQAELMPVGSASGKIGDTETSNDVATAYGISAAFDYAVTPYISIGVAPRLILNIKAAQNDDTADKELDLRARIVGHAPVAKGLELFAALTPGYTIEMSSQDGVDSPKGFVLGGAVGATYDLSPSTFVTGEVGYQRAFTSTDIMLLGQSTSADLQLSYLHVGIGAGARF